MIAKEVATPRSGGSFRSLVNYLTSSLGKAERVGRIRLTNCVSGEVGSALLEVDNTQRYNYRSRHLSYHVMLSFRERPTAELLELVERRACEALGYAQHQRVSVLHTDTDHPHLHIAINRVHPTTHRVHSPSYSKLVLDRLCVELERELGLAPDRHRFLESEGQLKAIDDLRAQLTSSWAGGVRSARSWAEVLELSERQGVRMERRGNGIVLVSAAGLTVKASTVARDMSKKALERRLGAFDKQGLVVLGQPHSAPDLQSRANRRPHDMEHAAGVESLVGFIQRRCADAFRMANSWSEVHDVAGEHGLRLELRGNGLIFVSTEGVVVKASSVARDLSKPAFEHRLGAFEAAASRPRQGVPSTHYAKVPLRQTPALYARYEESRALCAARRAEIGAQLRKQRQQMREHLRRQSKRRWAGIRLVARGRLACKLWIAYARRADRLERERATRKLRAAARNALSEQPRAAWLDWLRQRAGEGDLEALLALRNRADAKRPRADAVFGQAGAAGLIPALPVDSITPAGTIVYRIGKSTIRDVGDCLQLSSQKDDEGSDALLRIAYARFGSRIGVDGDEKFKARLVRAAVSSRLPIRFADEHLERSRAELERVAQHDEQTPVGPQRHAGRARARFRARERDTAWRQFGIHQPHALDGRPAASPEASNGLRAVSSIDVVRFGDAPQVLLPNDARADLEQRGSRSHSVVRRDHPQQRVETELVRRRRGPRP